MKSRSFAALVILVMIALSMFASAAFAAEDDKAWQEARMQWWSEARFGLFIHWGIYAVPAGTYKGKQIGGLGEWIMNSAKIPVEEYAKYAAQFNPVKFNGRCTRRGDSLYVHVFEWPREGVKLTGLVTPIGSATFLNDGSKADYTRAGDAEGAPILTIMPPAHSDPLDTVVELLLAGPLEVMPAASEKAK